MKSLTVDPRSAVPPFEQIRGQIASLVSAGTLRPGDRLPPVRQLAADLGLAVGTVNRAYRELEAEGIVITRRRTGTHITEAVKPRNADEAAQLLNDAARAYVRAALGLGVTGEAALGAVAEAVEQAAAAEAAAIETTAASAASAASEAAASGEAGDSTATPPAGVVRPSHRSCSANS